MPALRSSRPRGALPKSPLSQFAQSGIASFATAQPQGPRPYLPQGGVFLWAPGFGPAPCFVPGGPLNPVNINRKARASLNLEA